MDDSGHTPQSILETAFQRANTTHGEPLVSQAGSRALIELIARNISNGAVVRLLMACTLAKVHKPRIDIRKPYTEIGGPDAYSGRTYDEQYITAFINRYSLPCNPTTAFLTPALRNRNATLTTTTNLVGRPANLYSAVLQLLTNIQDNLVAAEDVLAETVRLLLSVKEERRARMKELLAGIETTAGAIPLSAEAIITLVKQHLACKGASRLPVLIVAAAYNVAGVFIGESALPLGSHNAADKQTGAVGDVEVTLTGDNNVATGYEMKMRRVTQEDVDHAVHKIHNRGIHHYVFITTEPISVDVQEYAASLYEPTGGIEIAILDCIGFLRHFLHLFHRLRAGYLEAYQNLVLSEPDSAVGQALKEAWLALRQSAEVEV